MRVAEVRNRVVERLGEAAVSGDEDVAAQALDFCGALLIALASEDADSDVNVQTLAIKTGTAGRILGLNQEYVRELIRRRVLGATKSNGEFQVPLSAMVSFQAKSVKFSTSPVPPTPASGSSSKAAHRRAGQKDMARITKVTTSSRDRHSGRVGAVAGGLASD